MSSPLRYNPRNQQGDCTIRFFTPDVGPDISLQQPRDEDADLTGKDGSVRVALEYILRFR